MPRCKRHRLLVKALIGGALMAVAYAGAAAAQTPSPQQQAFRDIYRELVEIDTTDTTGDTLKAAEAMAARLKSAGFPGGRHPRDLDRPAQGQPGGAAARHRRAQAGAAARAYRRRAGG